jgi:hypothetical protein
VELYITQDANGVKAQVQYIDNTNIDQQALRDMNATLLKGGAPPYILTSVVGRPSVEQTIKLFKLAGEQAFPLRIMIERMEMEAAWRDGKSVTAVPQMKMNIMGGAGEQC